MELLRRTESAAAGDDDLGAGQLGTLALRGFDADEAADARIAAGVDLLDRAAAAFALGLREGRAANGKDLLGVAGADGGDGVAGVDRTGERILVLDRQDLGNLHHVEQGRDARSDVLAGRRRGGDERVVRFHQLGGDRRDVLGEAVVEMRGVGDMHLADAGDLRCRLGDATDVRPGDERMDFAQLRRGGDGCKRGVLDLAALVLDVDERLHATTPSVFSLPISSSTEPTLSPACRLAGSTTFSVSRRRAMSTPSSSGVLAASGFDFAFMMFGSEA